MELQELFTYLETPKNIVLITHVRPDGDAVGSSLALQHYLSGFGHTVQSIVPDDIPSFLQWMPGAASLYNHQRNPKTCFAVLTKADCIFFLDFNALKRVEAIATDIAKLRNKTVTVMIDHHREPDFFTDYMLWDAEASSTAELIYRFIHLHGHPEKMTLEAAQCIYTGMVTDTGVFQYSNTTPAVHTIAADLMSRGVDAESIHNAVYNQFGENRLRFVGYLLSEKMVVLAEQRAAYMSISIQEAERFSLSTGDKEGIVNLPLSMKEVDIAVLFTEDKDRIKISFRSKSHVNVEGLARNFFKGGGHINAAGGSTRQNLADTIAYFEKVLPEYLTSIT
ncbi:MAG: DHH family phosphoesterase [Chitinophagales bacterium]